MGEIRAGTFRTDPLEEPETYISHGLGRCATTDTKKTPLIFIGKGVEVNRARGSVQFPSLSQIGPAALCRHLSKIPEQGLVTESFSSLECYGLWHLVDTGEEESQSTKQGGWGFFWSCVATRFRHGAEQVQTKKSGRQLWGR